MRLGLLQGSLSPDSHTAVVMRAVRDAAKDFTVEWLDLRERNAEFCDGRDLEEYGEETRKLAAALATCDAYVIGFPVYNYSVSGVVKNVVDICSHGMRGKVAGLVSNSGGVRSFMASVDLMKILSYHDSIMVVQPTVHTWDQDFQDERLANPKVHEKIQAMLAAIRRELR